MSLNEKIQRVLEWLYDSLPRWKKMFKTIKSFAWWLPEWTEEILEIFKTISLIKCQCIRIFFRWTAKNLTQKNWKPFPFVSIFWIICATQHFWGLIRQIYTMPYSTVSMKKLNMKWADIMQYRIFNYSELFCRKRYW